MQARSAIPVSTPQSNPTISYWQCPPASIADISSPLPAVADIVVIGSGITGACIAYNLLQRGRRVLMIEARQACSGATGRNGGHTKAASYRSFLEHEKEYGIDEAIKIAKMEYENIRATHAFAREHNIECRSVECNTVDLIYSSKQMDRAIEAITRMRQEHPAWEHSGDNHHPASQYAISDNTIRYAAGSINAYAFTIGMLKLCLEQGLELQTHTVVTEVSSSQVVTSRGTITANAVVVATNGYTASIIPEMQGLIVPLHGQVCAQRSEALPTTHSFIYESGYEYMIHSGDDCIIGGGIHKLPNAGESRYGNTDDSSLDPVITEYLRTANKVQQPGAVIQEWSGIMGATADGLPYVGSLRGMWMAAGFNGHGMVLCLKVAEALVAMMHEEEVVWFPKSMVLTEERLKVKFAGRKDLNVPGEASFKQR